MEEEVHRIHDWVYQLTLQVNEGNARQDERLRALEALVLRQDAVLQAVWQQQVELKNALRAAEVLRQQTLTQLSQMSAFAYMGTDAPLPAAPVPVPGASTYPASPIATPTYAAPTSAAPPRAATTPAPAPGFVPVPTRTPQAAPTSSRPVSMVAAAGAGSSSLPPRHAPRPTVLPAANFNADKDAAALHKAMKGFGTDERRIIEVLGYRSYPQREAIAKAYETLYKKKLSDALASETSNNFKNTLLALLMSPARFDASEVRAAVKGLGTDDDALIEVLCSRNNASLRAMREAYKEEFGREMAQDVQEDTSGDYRKLLLELIKGERAADGPVDDAAAREDASLLYKAGEGKLGTDEDTFINILTTRSYSHLRAVLHHYAQISDYDLERAIKKEMSANLKKALISICKFARDPYSYFAERLEKMMKGMGTNDRGLIRIIVSRCEVDLGNIKTEYANLYKRTLETAVKSETSGDYRQLLNALISGGSQFKPEEDAKALRRAMKGIGTDNEKLIQILGTRTLSERMQIAEAYKSAYQRSLREDLKKETSGDFAKLLDCMMMTPAEFDAWTVQRCVKGLGTDDDTLIEVLCTRNNAEIKAMIAEYQTMFGRELIADVRSDTSGDYRDILLGLLAAQRDETSDYVDPAAAKEDAAQLYKAGEGKIGTDEKTFIDILTRRNFRHLRAVFDEYDQLCDYSIEKSISRETSFNFKKALLAIVRAVRNPADYFAERLMLSMKGAGTNDLQLIRVVVTRAEKDLGEIHQVYKEKYKISLEKAIENDTSGNYRRLLIKIVEFAAGIAPPAYQ